MKILVIRTDRIGDLILSIPVVRAIKSVYPDVGLGFLSFEIPGQLISEIKELDYKYFLKSNYSNYSEILNEIRKENFTHAICLFVDRKASWIPLDAKIPNRIGPYSKALSLIKFNNGMIQKRSCSIKNEAEYNLSLLKKIGITYKTLPLEAIKPQLEITCDNSISLPDTFIAIHPGMGGSALNLSNETYIDVAKLLSDKENIIFTFGPGEEVLYNKFKKHFRKDQLKSNISLKTLCGIYQKAKLYIGASTGPTHIAAAVGTKTFAIYSPIKVQSCVRWGPWGNYAKIFTPDVVCKEKYKCKKSCNYYSCIKDISPDTIYNEIIAFMEK